tara:strand:+ start:259 stop:489 length:231 start_codon:yes stop_codon:yes gene_type:complete
MYREPHLQKKSDECAEIWREWFAAQYTEQDKEKAKKLRKIWCNCCDEFGEMVSEEVKTNPRYKDVIMHVGSSQPPT